MRLNFNETYLLLKLENVWSIVNLPYTLLSRDHAAPANQLAIPPAEGISSKASHQSQVTLSDQ